MTSTDVLLPPGPVLAAFVVASLILSITPGPGVLYIVTRTLAQGRAAGLASVAGVALGNLGNASGASIGLAALFAVSSLAFTVVKFGGAIYLIWLGIKVLRSRPGAVGSPGFEAPRFLRIFRDGFVVALLNPKTALFFAAFLPQFMGRAGSPMTQSLALGALFVAIAASTDAAYALAAGAASSKLAGVGRRRAWPRYLGAATYFALAAWALAFGSRPAPKT